MIILIPLKIVHSEKGASHEHGYAQPYRRAPGWRLRKLFRNGYSCGTKPKQQADGRDDDSGKQAQRTAGLYRPGSPIEQVLGAGARLVQCFLEKGIRREGGVAVASG
jgi:hypothetical protein